MIFPLNRGATNHQRFILPTHLLLRPRVGVHLDVHCRFHDFQVSFDARLCGGHIGVRLPFKLCLSASLFPILGYRKKTPVRVQQWRQRQVAIRAQGQTFGLARNPCFNRLVHLVSTARLKDN